MFDADADPHPWPPHHFALDQPAILDAKRRVREIGPVVFE
jgi:hypothetical protein